MVEIDQFNKIPCKIKHFNNKSLNLDNMDIIDNIKIKDPNYLNMEGYLKNNYIKFEPEV